MHRYMSELIGCPLRATDGEIGKVKDVYFDDYSWTVRYLVVETGNWLFERKVLISPYDAGVRVDPDSQTLPVELTRDQVKRSPDVDTELPVSRQQESNLFDYYSWPSFGRAGMGYPTTGMLKAATDFKEKMEGEKEFDPHLRSFRHVGQYEIHNDRGRLGLVKDLTIALDDWSIPRLLIDDVFTSDQERVIIPTSSILKIDWSSYQIMTSLSQEDLDRAPRINSPGFWSEESKPLGR
ncbi:PRC-barrel domain-containing protein [Pedobacter faecalis]|uniref:PRC-barrel domain-containing protein n=1 Tax=Pedobacter faecalis TaxID=3041495 RepID=UPI00254ECFEE|nr:PRC-barrel domain-containing protein [Pedobacter sp. ELA7]